jgi:Lysylphosphatidylglycerol synthase TM region
MGTTAAQTQCARSPRSLRWRAAAINAAAYAVAAVIIWWLARGIPLAQLTSDLVHARLTLFVPAAIASLALWIVGDTLVYARLFSYFHAPTRFREMLPGTATHEFLQVVNAIAASTSLALFVQARKGVDWLSAACTLGLLGFIDLQSMAWMLLIAARVEPRATLGIAWYYPALFICGSCGFAAFWLHGRPRSQLGQWLYRRPFFTAFRQARLAHYLTLSLIRIPTFAAQGVVLYLEMIAFGIRAPLSIVMATLPVVLIAGAMPGAPSGLGTRQAAIVVGFRQFGSRASLLTMSLAHGWLVITLRLVLGLTIGVTVFRSLLQGSDRNALSTGG